METTNNVGGGLTFATSENITIAHDFRFVTRPEESHAKSRVRYYRELQDQLNQAAHVACTSLGLERGQDDPNVPRATVVHTLRPWTSSEVCQGRGMDLLGQLGALLELIPEQYRKDIVLSVDGEDADIAWEAPEHDLDYARRVFYAREKQQNEQQQKEAMKVGALLSTTRVLLRQGVDPWNVLQALDECRATAEEAALARPLPTKGN